MSVPPPLNFNCDSCSQPIYPANPRIRCLICPDYDLCANCGVGERFTQGHNEFHQTQIFKQSGGNGQPAVVATSRNNCAASQQPPPIPQPAPSPLQMPQQAPPNQATQNYASPGQGWQPFFLPDMTPSPTFVTLMNDIFTYLDPMNNGNLEPETYSRFLDDLGYLGHENSWKSGLQGNAFGMSKESNADKMLKNAYDLFSIDHLLLQRIRPAIQSSSNGGGGGGLASSFSRALRNSVSTQPSHQGPMPAITRKGFIDITTVDFLSDPSKEWGNLSRCLRKYNLPKYAAWGDLPRSTFPAMPDPAMLQRVAGVTQYAQQRAAREIEVARATAMLSARANQAAVDAIGGTRTEYTYRY